MQTAITTAFSPPLNKLPQELRPGNTKAVRLGQPHFFQFRGHGLSLLPDDNRADTPVIVEGKE
jgi:hypothetical protein